MFIVFIIIDHLLTAPVSYANINLWQTNKLLSWIKLDLIKILELVEFSSSFFLLFKNLHYKKWVYIRIVFFCTLSIEV